MVDDKFDLHSMEIKKQLRIYGQDLATRGVKGQPFGAVEITLALIPIIGWFLTTILKVIVEHEVKKRLIEKPGNKLSDLEARLRELESLINKVLQHEISVSAANEELRRSYYDIIQRFKARETSEFKFTKEQIDDLLEVLQNIGLTHRRALRLSVKIIDISVQFLNNHTEMAGNAYP